MAITALHFWDAQAYGPRRFHWGPLQEHLGMPRAGSEQGCGVGTRLGAVREYLTEANQS